MDKEAQGRRGKRRANWTKRKGKAVNLAQNKDMIRSATAKSQAHILIVQAKAGAGAEPGRGPQAGMGAGQLAGL